MFDGGYCFAFDGVFLLTCPFVFLLIGSDKHPYQIALYRIYVVISTS